MTEEEIRQALNELAELKILAETLAREKQTMLEVAMPAEVRDALHEIDAEFAPKLTELGV